MTSKRHFGRFKIIILIAAAVAAVIIWQYFSIMVLHQGGEDNALTGGAVVERGPILDRDGRILAIQTELSSVTAWTPNITDPEETAGILQEILQINKETLLDKFRSRNGFLYIKRKITPNESRQIEEKKEEGFLRGISLDDEYGRNYPEKNLASHVLGYVGTDNIGLSGIEYAYDSELSPSIPEEFQGKTFYGNQVFLTIDLPIQYFAEEIAEKAYNEHKADSVMILVMEANTADILGYVSLPDFDPNSFAKFSSSARENRPISFAYEPGSVFKAFSMASFLELGSVQEDDTFFCGGYYEIDLPNGETETINCLGNHGSVTPQKIIQYSCNAGAAYASESTDKFALYEMLRAFGFGSPTGLPFSGESHGILRSPELWSVRSKPTIAMGQEISVSAVQVITAATAIANEGVLLKPNIVRKIVNPEGKIIQESESRGVRRVLSADTAKNMLSFMETATRSTGTAWRAAIDGIQVAAKTGTAQMLDTKTGKYSKDAYIASCLAIFPAEAPEIIAYVVIENPKSGEYFGGRIAAPLIKELGEQLVPYLGIPREGDLVIEHPGKIEIHQEESLVLGDSMPDLIGKSKKFILPLLSRRDITVILSGEGWIVNQSPQPGTPITKGMTIRLEFK